MNKFHKIKKKLMNFENFSFNDNTYAKLYKLIYSALKTVPQIQNKKGLITIKNLPEAFCLYIVRSNPILRDAFLYFF